MNPCSLYKNVLSAYRECMGYVALGRAPWIGACECPSGTSMQRKQENYIEKMKWLTVWFCSLGMFAVKTKSPYDLYQTETTHATFFHSVSAHFFQVFWLLSSAIVEWKYQGLLQQFLIWVYWLMGTGQNYSFWSPDNILDWLHTYRII